MTRHAYREATEAAAQHKTSRYSVLPHPQGFRVEGGEGRCPVAVSLHSTYWSVTGIREGEVPPSYTYTYGLVAFRSLLHGIASRLMESWNPPLDGGQGWGGIYEWALGRTSAAIGRRVYAEWKRLLATVPQDAVKVSRAVFAATFDGLSDSLGCESWEELYAGKYARLVGDILNYRAAALACHNAPQLIANVAESLRIRREMLHPTPPFPGPAELRFGAARDPRWSSPFGEGEEDSERQQARARRLILDLLADDWKALFAPGAVSYRSLNQTLMRLPGGVPFRLCSSFPFAELTRPMTDRVELVTLLLFCEQMARYSYPLQDGEFEHRPPPAHWAYKTFAKATRENILRALKRLSAHERQPSLQTPTASNLNTLVRFLILYCAAYPEGSHTGTIVGLTERAIEQWNQDFRQRLADALDAIDRHAPLAVPPIPPPESPAIRLLTTAGEVVEEGANMQHCLPLYATDAIQGKVYLFHITYRGSEATAMVSNLGMVEQCQGGPRGSRLNAARTYGTRVLSQWGKALCPDPVGGESSEAGAPSSSEENDALPF